MAMFFIIFFVMLLFVAAMAVGVIMGRKPLAGSCGGVGKALGEPDYECHICGGDESKCESNLDESANESTDLSYDATSKK
jgi:uncharacterized protein